MNKNSRLTQKVVGSFYSRSMQHVSKAYNYRETRGEKVKHYDRSIGLSFSTELFDATKSLKFMLPELISIRNVNMKAVVSFLFVIMLALLFSSCRSAAQPDVTPLAESMKGYELYSWQEGNQWRFSLLVGTNREKTLDEIKSIDTVLPDVDALMSILEKVPAGQYVTWSSKETSSFPPDDIIQQVEKICKDKGLILTIAQ